MGGVEPQGGRVAAGAGVEAGGGIGLYILIQLPVNVGVPATAMQLVGDRMGAVKRLGG